MRSLFLKIFLSFWLMTALIFALSVLTSERPHRAEVHALWHSMISSAVRVNAVAIIQSYEDHGCDGFTSYAHQMRHASRLLGFLFDSTGKQLCGPPAPMPAKQLASSLSASSGLRFSALQTFAGLQQVSNSGHPYVFVVGLPSPPPFPTWLVLSHLAIAFAVSGLICFLLARYLARPIGTVRLAAQQIAAGDLKARAGAPAVERGDEVGDLARDFDYMAAKLESLFHAQGRLISDISHELRSPLARLSVALGIARQHTPAEATVALDRIEREADRLNQMVERLLTLSRLEAANEPPQQSAVQLGEILREAAADADFEARSRNCKVELRRIDDCKVSGNRNLLRSAIENVLRNAVQYTAANTTVEAELRCLGEDLNRIAQIEVRDYGPGVPQDELQNLFRPFYRLDQSRERLTGGAGLGLAIAERAIKLHHGTLEAQNATGGGLLLRITLPALLT